jgi:hypothetical protein
MPVSENGLGLEVHAGLTAAVNGLAARADRDYKLAARKASAIRQVPISPPAMTLVSGAGTQQLQPAMGPPQGFYWGIRRLTAYGFSAGTVVAYIDNVNGEPLLPFTVQGVATFSKGQALLHPMSQLVIQATGITGTVQIWGAADCFESWYLPYYLG